jgi:hypothetical protein
MTTTAPTTDTDIEAPTPTPAAPETPNPWTESRRRQDNVRRESEMAVTRLLLSHPKWSAHGYEDFLRAAVKAAYDGTLKPGTRATTMQEVLDAQGRFAAHLLAALDQENEAPVA